jgi:hypothetical protein
MARARAVAVVVCVLAAIAPARAAAQSVLLKVIGSDSIPVPFAWVAVEGAIARITDETGVVSLGPAKHKVMTVSVRRIGYQPWYGKMEIPDTAATLTLSLPRVVQEVAGVTITGRAMSSHLELAGFYDRWLQRQKGLLSATFIGPEEIERRNPARTSDLLAGLNGVSLLQGAHGERCVMGYGTGGLCFMTIVVDGSVLRPTFRMCTLKPLFGGSGALQGPDINEMLDPADLAGVEIYARGANMPIKLQGVDNTCGVMAIWTGTRH